MKKQLTFATLIIALSAFAFTPSQVFNTSIKLFVRNELGNLEEGVEVQLFATEKDYREETNPVTDIQKSDKKGVVRFKDLKPQVYFINAKKGDKSNVGAGVQTGTLEEGKLNKMTIIIE